MSPTQIKKSVDLEPDDLLKPEAELKNREKMPAIEPKEVFSKREKESPAESGKEKPDRTKRQAPAKAERDFSAASQAGPAKSPALLQIENLLEQDLKDVYFQMDGKKKEKFKFEGESTALKIELLLGKTRDATKKIFKLILKWLNLIPGVNKFFIKQEAIIKTEKIMQLKDGQK